MSTQRKRGRPRSASAHRAILEATARLLERTAVRNITIEGVAREAGVGKPTIYRWWDGKCSLVMEAFLELTSPRASFPEKASSTVEAISLHVRRVVKLLRGEVGRVAAEMIGEGQADPGFLEKFRREFFSQLLAPAREAIERAKASGELAESLDTDLALDLIYGPIYFRLLLGHNRLDEPFARALSEKVQSALTAS